MRAIHLQAVATGVAATMAMPVTHAHTLAAHGGGFLAGALHPLLGVDHLLAMLAVGLWAARQAGALRWRLPLGFLGLVLAGASLGLSGAPLQGVETGIVTSVLLLGLLVATAARLPATPALALVGVFGLLHGHAHGAEWSQAGSMALYMAGLLLTAALLLLAGLLSGRWLWSARRSWSLRAAGLVVAVGGVAMWT